MSFLLDTSTCVFALNRAHGVAERMLAHRRNEVWVSALTRAELLAAAAASGSPARNVHRAQQFLSGLTTIDFSAADADTYATIRARMEKKGLLIGPIDLLIAAQAVSRDLTMVTDNEKEFRRVPGLALVNWATRG
jgi:tRNA(fMet)-specific endonuclease VapC